MDECSRECRVVVEREEDVRLRNLTDLSGLCARSDEGPVRLTFSQSQLPVMGDPAFGVSG